MLLGAAALLIGISKTSVGGLAAIAVAVFASVMPAKESTAAVLLLLLTGDVVAVARYRRGADWGLLRRLLPSVLPGLALGTTRSTSPMDCAPRSLMASESTTCTLCGTFSSGMPDLPPKSPVNLLPVTMTSSRSRSRSAPCAAAVASVKMTAAETPRIAKEFLELMSVSLFDQWP